MQDDREKTTPELHKWMRLLQGIQDFKGACTALADSEGDAEKAEQAVAYMRSSWFRLGAGLFPLAPEEIMQAVVLLVREAATEEAQKEASTTLDGEGFDQ